MSTLSKYLLGLLGFLVILQLGGTAQQGVLITDLDSRMCTGLTGTTDSLCYRVNEIEKHMHNSAQWFGKDGGDNYLNRDSITAWQVTAGAGEAYGNELQISDGTEIEAGSATKKFDFHKFLVTASSSNSARYKIQVWTGTGLFAAATLISEIIYKAEATQRTSPIEIMAPRVTCNNKIWVRIKSSTDNATIDILVAVHTYAG